jgi:hypothetical protein
MNTFLKIMQMVSILPTIIANVQSAVGKGNGPAKHADVKQIIESSINSMELIKNEDIIDNKGFHKGVDNLIKAMVQIIKSTKWGRQAGF